MKEFGPICGMIFYVPDFPTLNLKELILSGSWSLSNFRPIVVVCIGQPMIILTLTIDSMISNFRSSRAIALGDFNIHNKDWFGSTTTDLQGRVAKSFAVSNDLTNII